MVSFTLRVRAFSAVSMGWKLFPPWLDCRSWIFGIDCVQDCEQVNRGSVFGVIKSGVEALISLNQSTRKPLMSLYKACPNAYLPTRKKRAEFRWVSRQDVRGAARAYIDDTDDQINVYPEQQGFGHQPFKNEGWTQDDKASTNEGRAMLVQKSYNGELPRKIQNIDREEAGKMTLYCTVVLRNKQETTEVMNKAMPSFERITLKNKATFN
ncbi:hypothetical protein POTOM_031821 [Populus tomentosa]|uniref:Uncharacterized protein n=1 Tax=Populus tomentosa TaxID=118781 RepID=A0A8X7Z901_POPTO|nr:hypothetical protein POTOM_031821 [Populus tomentosa]